MFVTADMDGLAEARKGERGEHERAAVGNERQRDADDGSGLDGHGDVDEGVRGKDGGGAQREAHAHFVRRENGGAA